MLNTALFLLGAACLIAAPVLNIFSFLLLVRMRRAINSANPSIWQTAVRPRTRPGIWPLQGTGPALAEFLTTHPYLATNRATITRLAVAYKVSRKAAVASLLGAVVTMLWALKIV